MDYCFISIIDVNKPPGKRNVGILLMKHYEDSTQQIIECNKILAQDPTFNFNRTLDFNATRVPDTSEDVKVLPLNKLVAPLEAMHLGYKTGRQILEKGRNESNILH